MREVRPFLAAALLVASTLAAAEDPLTLPTPRPSKGAYQYGVEMLGLDNGATITRPIVRQVFAAPAFVCASP